MLAFAIFVFALGAGLAAAMSVPQFALGALVLAACGFAQAIRVGIPPGLAVLASFVLFFCAQLGYVAGIGAKALLLSRSKRSNPREAPPPALDENGKTLIP